MAVLGRSMADPGQIHGSSRKLQGSSMVAPWQLPGLTKIPSYPYLSVAAMKKSPFITRIMPKESSYLEGINN
jgi:hypothetical protein